MKRKLTWKERWKLFWGIEAPEPQYEIVERNTGWCTVHKHYYFKATYGYKKSVQYLGEETCLEEAQKLVERVKAKEQGKRIKQIHYL